MRLFAIRGATSVERNDAESIATIQRALDLGTGNGILALLCSTHAEHVVGTDINEHALELAQLNAALNGIENVEFRLNTREKDCSESA